MKKATLTILGIATLLLSLTLNFRHALNNYGILDNKLHVEVLAQSNSSGGGGGSSSDSWEPDTGSGSGLGGESNYYQGTWGTNWKTYSISCTISYSIGIGSTYVKREYVALVDVCGKGTGLCITRTGC